MIKTRSQALVCGVAGDGGIEGAYTCSPQIGFLLFLKVIFSSVVLGQEKDEAIFLVDF